MHSLLYNDFMAIGAHPDDVEIMAGGTLIKMVQQGYRGGIVDLTAGELGTRGTIEIREKEANTAAKILGTSFRECAYLSDGNIQNNLENRRALVALIRKYRPKVILTHAEIEEHPDHKATSYLVQDATFLAGVSKFEEEYALGEPFRPARIFHFIGFTEQEPQFCVDISEQMQKKMDALLSYKSQFYTKSMKTSNMPKTDLASPEFLENIKIRNRFYGIRIKKKYAEPFLCKELPEIQDLVGLGGTRFS